MTPKRTGLLLPVAWGDSLHLLWPRDSMGTGAVGRWGDNGVERPVKAAELFAFTLRVRAGNTDVLTDAEENVRQKLRAEGVM